MMVDVDDDADGANDDDDAASAAVSSCFHLPSQTLTGQAMLSLRVANPFGLFPGSASLGVR